MSTPTRPLSGAVSRRTLLQGLAALGVGASLFGAAGCESAVSQSQASGSTDTPQRGGTIQAGIAADVIPGNFLTNSNTGVTTIVGLAYDFLIRYPNDKVEPTPRLATAWELAPDGRSLTLDLRDDVTFHSGRPFTSKDVEFSIKTYADPLWTAQLRSTAAAVTSFDTSDEHHDRARVRPPARQHLRPAGHRADPGLRDASRSCGREPSSSAPDRSR